MTNNLTIAVIGMGLIGGSILKSLKSKHYKLIGVSRRQETIDKAFEEHLISEGSTDINAVKDANIIFICTPIHNTVFILNEVAKIANPDAIITDVAGIKGFIMDFVNTSHEPINFIGGHPMAGTENKGLDSSLPDLFSQSKWILTPSKWSTCESIDLLTQIIRQTNAEIIIADPEEHDKAVSMISHMPLFLSQALFNFIETYPEPSTKELALQLASSGFRDMTRLASTNPELATDMLFENKNKVIDSFKKLLAYSKDLEICLSNDEEKFNAKIIEIAESRKKMFSPEGKNIYKKKDRNTEK